MMYDPRSCCGGKRGIINVSANGNVLGSVRQGQTCSWVVPPGAVSVSAKLGGVGGFFKGLAGANQCGTHAVGIQTGQTVVFRMRWVGGCCSSRKMPVFEPM